MEVNTILNGSFLIGKWTDNTMFANGNIDEVSVWNRALTQQQINDIQYASINSNENGLVGYWRFDRGATINAIDISQNRNHGNIFGAAWSEDRIDFLPKPTLLSSSSYHTNESEIEIEVEFSVPVGGLVPNEIEIFNGTISEFTGSGNIFNFTYNIESEGQAWIYIPSDVCYGIQTGEQNAESDTLFFLYDITSPILTISSQNGTLSKTSPIPFQIDFSEPVLGFIEDDIQTSYGTILNFSNDLGLLNILDFNGQSNFVQSQENIPISGNSAKSLFVRFRFNESPIGVQYVAGWGWNGEGGQPGNQNFSIASTPYNHPDLYSSNNNLMMWGVGAPNVTDIQFNYFLNPGEWCDALITHDGVELKIYVDGVLTNSQEYSSDVFSSPLILGKKIGSYSDREWFDGSISKVMIYDRVLTENEAESFYDSNIAPENGIVLHYNFQEGEGQELNDLSLNNNNGNIEGSIWLTDNFYSSSSNETTYFFNLEVAQDNLIHIDIPSNAFTDLSGNPNLTPFDYQVTFNGVPPSTPENLFAFPGDEEVTLTWDFNVEGDIENYLIYMNGNNQVPLDSTLNTQNSIQISNLQNYVEYNFQVSAKDTVGNESSPSNQPFIIPYSPLNTNSLSFDGENDFVDPQASFPDITNTFTMSMWAKPISEHEIDNESTAGGVGNAGQKYAIFPTHGGLEYGAGHAGAGISIGTNGISVYEHSNSYVPAILVHEVEITDWVHVAVVYENKTPRLYLNGNLVKTGLTSFKTVHPSAGKGDLSDAQLGGFGGGQFGQEASFFQGWLDEIRFYDRALEPNEIIEGMNAVLNVPTEENLIGYWRFDEGNGLNAIDIPSRNDGQIIGANCQQSFQIK